MDAELSKTLLESLGIDLSHISTGSALIIIFVLWMARERVFKKKLNGHSEHPQEIFSTEALKYVKEDISLLFKMHELHAKEFSNFKITLSKEIGEIKGKLDILVKSFSNKP